MADPRYLTENYAVSPQITVGDLADLKEQGFKTIVCNRPDAEIPPEAHADVMEKAARELGLNFVLNPLTHGALTQTHIDIQRDAANGEGPVFAYCASGNRCSILWGLAMAGTVSTEDILSKTTAAGYDLRGLAPQLDAMANAAKA